MAQSAIVLQVYDMQVLLLKYLAFNLYFFLKLHSNNPTISGSLYELKVKYAYTYECVELRIALS